MAYDDVFWAPTMALAAIIPPAFLLRGPAQTPTRVFHFIIAAVSSLDTFT